MYIHTTLEREESMFKSRPVQFVTIAASAVALSSAANAQDGLGVTDRAAYLLPEAEEVSLSRSAAPATISNDASVLVLEGKRQLSQGGRRDKRLDLLHGKELDCPRPFQGWQARLERSQFQQLHPGPAMFQRRGLAVDVENPQDRNLALHEWRDDRTGRLGHWRSTNQRKGSATGKGSYVLHVFASPGSAPRWWSLPPPRDALHAARHARELWQR